MLKTGLDQSTPDQRPAIIYALCCPKEHSVRYVGKTIDLDVRLRRHLRDARSGRLKYHHGRWLRSLAAEGMQPEAVTLFRVPLDMQWQAMERFFIASSLHMGFALTNSTPGGEGVDLNNPDAYSRWIAARSTVEYKARHSAAIAAAMRRPEVIQAMIEKTRAYWNDPKRREYILARIRSPEAIANRSAASLIKWADPQYRALHSESMKAAHGTPEARVVQSNRARIGWCDPDANEQRIAKIRAAHDSPETKALMRDVGREIGNRRDVKAKKSATDKASWEDPEVRARREAALGSDETRAKMSSSAKASWTDPDVKAARSASMKAGRAAKKEQIAAARKAMWADPVRRAELIAQQQASWVKRKANAALKKERHVQDPNDQQREAHL